MGTFLECLEPYILGDKLTSIPPSVMKDFVDHYQSLEMLESVEACIVHLEVTSLDIHQVCDIVTIIDFWWSQYYAIIDF